ncbi:hypothetical protein [Liquorilactobacillus ghanensis]
MKFKIIKMICENLCIDQCLMALVFLLAATFMLADVKKELAETSPFS